MAVKLSSYYSFRNNDLMRLIEDEWVTGTFAEKVSAEDKKNLQFLVDELDHRKEDSHFQQGAPIFERAIIPDIVELKDVTSNSEYAAVCLQAVFRIMAKYSVRMGMYDKLGKCFEELNIKPPADVAEALDYFSLKFRRRFASLDHVCWSSIKKYQNLRKNLK
ncbi:hypothetical protein KY312_03245 [Candidatus Woesearchaeota archaeon]|nr:hypothetical protein [Candidatus Woesearchaeota archaeon]